MPVNPGTEAVLLKDGALGVATETKTRNVQCNGRDNTYKVTLNREWLEELNIADQGVQTVHSKSSGLKPVLVQHPAIIVQPANIILEGED